MAPLRWLMLALLLTIGAIVQATAVAAFVTMRSLLDEAIDAPIVSTIDTGPQATVVYDRQDRPMFSLYTEQRTDVPLDQISPHMVHAVLAAEDRRFYTHHGLDPLRMAAAAIANLRAGRIVQGGSTITQQLVRATMLNGERTFSRKFKEVVLAAQVEEQFGKREILEAYLNRVYFGDGYYGVESAAQGYFGVSASELNPAEAALLGGLVRAPSALSPRRAEEPARVRRNAVLRAMLQEGWIAYDEFRAAAVSPISTEPRERFDTHRKTGRDEERMCGMYFKDEVRRQLVGLFGEDQVYQGGLRVFSTLDPQMQREAERAVTRRLTGMRSRLGPGGSALEGSLVALDPKTGEVLALVGGRDFHTAPFDRATQARRQPGSAFKPLIFAAALERGYAPDSVLGDLDAPIEGAEAGWLPSGEHEASAYTLRRALKVSSNRAAAQLLQHVGVYSAVDYAHRLGIRSSLPAVPSLALGTGEVTLLELTTAYTAFANEGVMVPPILIRRVEDADGRIVWAPPLSSRRALGPATAFLMSNMLADVMNSGTGSPARAMGFRLPAAGKTGTTSDFADAWFIGYTPRLLAGVWFGFDRPGRIMNEGFAAVVALPAWADFMKAATAHDTPEWFEMPSDVERVEICRVSAERAVDACRRAAALQTVSYTMSDTGAINILPRAGTYYEYFALGTGPNGTCHIHDPELAPISEPDDLLDPPTMEDTPNPGRPVSSINPP